MSCSPTGRPSTNEPPPERSTTELTARRPANVLTELLTGVCTRRADLDQLYSEPTRVTHPLGGDLLETRQQLREHFARAHRALDDVAMSVSNLVIHETADPQWIVAEFRYTIGQAAAEVPCVFVTRVRDGLILESRDYIDRAMFQRAIGAARRR